MHSRSVGMAGLALAALLLFGQELAAQNGTLTGRVTDVETGQPIPTAQVQVLGGAQDTGGLTDAQGVYRIQVPAGTYSIVVRSVGHQTVREDGVSVAAGGTTTVDIQLTSMALALNELVVSVGRGTPEKQVDAPAATHLVGATEIAERPAVTVADHLREAPATDIITTGVQSTNVVVRGFNNIFSGALHALTDHRLAGVPSLRVNLLHFVPTTNEDVERIEVVLGPGSALYGPNTANGVMHVFTKSPLTSQGTTVTLAAGEQSVFQGSFRSAFLLSDNFGFKVSGQYLRGDEWVYVDPAEEAARQSAATPEGKAACLLDKQIRGLSSDVGALACERVGTRDYDIERYGFEARADYRFADDGTFVATYGRTSASGIELTGLGAGQTKDWIYEFYQARLRKGRFFTQGYLNTSDAGGSWLLRDGVPLIDQSKLMVFQAQHGFSLADDRQDFTYGFDFFGTRPETKGSINGSYENDDNMDEWGVYLQSKTALSDKLDLILAARLDDHSALPEKVFSPRAALVVKPTEDQSIRFTYNRAFSTPSSLNLFLDISGGAAPAPLGPLGYTTRAYGTGANGYAFQQADGSYFMRSPFYPGGPGETLPANTSTLWALAMGVLNAQIAAGNPQLAPLAPLMPVLGGLNPGDSDIAAMFLDATTQELSPVASTSLPSVPGIRESNTETFEVGWQGVIDNKVRVSVAGYYMKKNNFVSPLLVQTPLLTLNGQDVASYITVPIVTALTQQFIAMGMDPATAQATAQAQAATIVPSVATAVAQIPLGVVTTPSLNGIGGSDLILTYRNVGDISLWGTDLAFSWFLNDMWTLNGTYSHVSDDYFEIEDGDPIALNAPKDKFMLSLAYRNVAAGFNAETRVRWNSEFPAESAGFVGTKCLTGGTGGIFEEDCIPDATLVDLNLGYKLPGTAATLQVAVSNLFDADYRSFVGAPTIGRMALLRVKYDLF